MLLDREAATDRTTHTLPKGTSELRLTLTLPEEGFRGYGIDLRVLDEAGIVVAEASTALDVLDDWTQAPRYGFLSDFEPGDQSAASNVQTLARYHVNVVQFYDWMWRHYILMPPADEYTDGMSRLLSMRTVREKIAACRGEGMAAIGYAAVYGAEPEYALSHPDQMLYDASGKPYSIEELFYVMNIHVGNPWREQILPEMARAVREASFDGLHLDQYGFPKDNAYGPGPNPKLYDLAEDFPPFIDDARVAIREARPGTRVIFNAVENWPIEAVAPTTQDAVYIEVWPPYENYSDLQLLILGARKLAPTKHVILAAYMAPLLEAVDDAVPPAERATRLASAAIWANGGFHLLMGERDGALTHAYYPKYATLAPAFAVVMRRYYDFVVRYENVLADRRLVTEPPDGATQAVTIAGHTATPLGMAGTIWTICRSMPGFRTLSLINLSAAADTLWNAPKPAVQPLHNLRVDLLVGAKVTSVFEADPDGGDTRPRQVTFTQTGEGEASHIHFEVPRLDYWTLVVARVDE
jgi:dextranase